MKESSAVSLLRNRRSNRIQIRFHYILLHFIIICFISISFTCSLSLNIIGMANAEVDPEILGSAPGRFNSVVADDIDGDGRTEIVFGNYEGFVSVLERRGDDYFEEWRSPDIGQRVWGIEVADLMGDSTKEIIAGNGDGEIHVYDAKTHKRVWFAEDLTRDVHGLFVHDLGRGGKPFLLAGTGYKTDKDLGIVYIFGTNESNGKFEYVSEIGQFENRMRGIGVGDVDGDGAVEIVFGSGVTTGERPGEGYVRVYDVEKVLNNQDGALEWKSSNLKGDCVALKLADFNDDGFPDIVVGNGYRYQAGWVRILTYDKTSSDYIEHWKSPDSPDIGPKVFGLDVGDIDDDGNLEIVVGNLAGYIYIFEKQGSTIVQEWKSKLLGSDIFGIDLYDVDDDGQIEIVASQGGYTGKGDYTSGYTEPHIYIIDGKTHEIETTVGETSLLDIILPISILILFVFFLLILNYYAKTRRRLKELGPDEKVDTKKETKSVVLTETKTDLPFRPDYEHIKKPPELI
jgi:hypothetical protein